MAAEGQALSGSELARRRMPRYIVQAPLDVTVLRSGIPEKIPGRSINLSERGLAAVLAVELATGEAVGVELRLPQRSRPFRSRAVVRYQDKLRYGMEFSGLSDEQVTAIRQWTEQLKTHPEMATESPKISSTPEPEALPEKPQEKIQEKTKEKPDTIHVTKKTPESPPPSPDAPAAKKSVPPKRAVLWKILLVLCAILLGVFWWRWNRGWVELESGLPLRQDAPVEQAQLHVPAEEIQKLVVHRVDPDYPAAARQAEMQGVIALDVVVGKDGTVLSVHPLNGPEVLARSAMDALRWWKFEPYRVNGAPITVETTLAVEFKP